jgi:cytoskeleton protein RodZ
MTESTDSTLAGPVGGDASPGAMLRRAREKQGMHIAALAAAIKVAPRKLEALEADRFDELPDASFTRALAQTVCRALKIDAAPVLSLLPQPGERALEAVGKGLNQPFRDRTPRTPGADRPILLRPALWLPLLVIAVAAALYWTPSRLLPTLGAPAGGASAATSPPSAPAVVREPVSSHSASPTVATGPMAEISTSGAAASTPTVEPIAAMPSPATPVDVATPPPATLQLRTTEPSWIEVTDSGGRLLISRVLEPGEGVDLDGTLPLRLRIGNALATQVTFRGQAVELARHTRENIARLELK